MDCPSIVIAGTHSGTGKTSVSLALVRSLTRKGLAVQTFKVGPDFLDPTYLTLASGRPCYNLDGWMTSRQYVRHLFERTTRDADIAVIEGVMGLFDGADPATSEGSTAEIARWLDAPVLLVVNAHGTARSLAATVKGFSEFEDVRLTGIVANQCGSERHAGWIRESLRSASLPPMIGAIPRGAFPELPSRHLGLVTADQRSLPLVTLDELADALEKHASVDDICAVRHTSAALADGDRKAVSSRCTQEIGVAYDQAFHFYYQDLFDELRLRGCEIIRFSPIDDKQLPEGLDGLYIGGGYPEVHVKALSANEVMLESIKSFAESGKPVYAECGGLMYLSSGLETLDGSRFPMVGLLPAWTRMRDKKRVLGYVEVTLSEDSLWGREGQVLRGHEFHYSELVEDPGWRRVYGLRRRRSDDAETEGFQSGNVLASYAHIHYASHPKALDRFVAMLGGSS